MEASRVFLRVFAEVPSAAFESTLRRSRSTIRGLREDASVSRRHIVQRGVSCNIIVASEGCWHVVVTCLPFYRGQPPRPGESAAEFAQRRLTAARTWARSHGRWSQRAASRIHHWHEHLLRGHSPSSWAARLCQVQGPQWLLQQRLNAGSLPSGGRTNTRVRPGRPAQRWHDTVAFARDHKG